MKWENELLTGAEFLNHHLKKLGMMVFLLKYIIGGLLKTIQTKNFMNILIMKLVM